MQSKILLVISALLAPLAVAAPTGNSEANVADHAIKDREMDPLFEVMAWKEQLDEILKNAMRNKADKVDIVNKVDKAEDQSSGKKHNNGWDHPIWIYN
ncbi:hypothetical protein F4678DRAFT_467864 [Xylaria arbuscula]|nr:hypothetical protein F4678DRAFT_467864 [Xylaria arbuscula]